MMAPIGGIVATRWYDRQPLTRIVTLHSVTGDKRMNRQLRAWLIVASASLTALSSIRTVNAQQVAPARRVWAGPVVDALKFFPSPSPDGRLLAYADAHTGELTLREIATGETRQLTDGSWDKGKNAFASWTAFSRDGKQIAYGWYNDSNPSYELRIIGIDGGAPRVVRHPLDKRGARPADWTPDGRYVVAVTTGDAQTAQLELVPAAGGPPRLLKSFPDWRRPKQVRVSPDGKYVAYDCPARKDAMERDIFLLALDGSRETTAIKWPGDVHFVGWTNDGRLTFTSDKAGSPAIWTVRVENGRPVGEPSLVTKDLWRSSGFDLAAQGSYFYVVETGDRDVFTAAFDPVVGKLLSKPLGLTHSPGEGYGGVAYSRDGRSVAYLSYRAPRMSYSAYSLVGDATITIQPLEGGQSRTLRPALAGVKASSGDRTTRRCSSLRAMTGGNPRATGST